MTVLTVRARSGLGAALLGAVLLRTAEALDGARNAL